MLRGCGSRIQWYQTAHNQKANIHRNTLQQVVRGFQSITSVQYFRRSRWG